MLPADGIRGREVLYELELGARAEADLIEENTRRSQWNREDAIITRAEPLIPASFAEFIR